MLNSIARDFGTLFSFLWYSECPLDGRNRASGSKSDWNIHSAFTVRKTAELFGLFVHFESGNRTDAVIRDRNGTPIAFIEWEWQSPAEHLINEPQKLSDSYKESSPQFCFLLTYVPEELVQQEIQKLSKIWQHDGTLVVCFVTFSGKTMRAFKDLCIYEISNGSEQKVRHQKALPWQIENSKWYAADS